MPDCLIIHNKIHADCSTACQPISSAASAPMAPEKRSLAPGFQLSHHSKQLKIIHLSLLTLFLFYLTSCNVGNTIEKVSSINADLISAFGHSNINSSLGWGTEENDNNLIVTFYEYDLDPKTYAELEQISNKVIDRILTKHPDLKEIDFIEVRFTKETDTENISSFVTFKNK